MAQVFRVKRVLFGVVMLATACAQPNEHDRFGAHFYCQEFVRRQLVSPSTAKFSSYAAGAVDSLANATYRVRGYVDAQNAMGGTPRTSYACTIRHDASDDSWGLVELDI